MSSIYTGIELGTDSIKIVVLEKINEQYHVLSSVCSESAGIRNSHVYDIKAASVAVKKAVKSASEMLGAKITKAIVCVPPTHCNMDIVNGSVDVVNSKITGEDVCNVLNEALKDQDFSEFELVTAIPISFTVDEEENIKDPKGMRGEVLSSKIVIGTMPKEELYRFLEVLKLAGVEAVDVGFTSTGDYYTIKNSKYDGIVGAIINIGEDNTNIAVYNKGIQIKNAVLPVGSSNVDKDLAYIFKMKENAARNLKETFAVSMSNYADSTDIVEVKNNNGEIKEISQVGVSKVVESRIREILKLAKNEIKNLTNREISYIIVTGGLSELAGFGYLVEEMFGAMAKVCNITTMGIRHNKYVSVLGIVKYLDDKLSLRGKQMNMIDGDELDDLVSPQHKMINNENIIGKVLGHFFDS